MANQHIFEVEVYLNDFDPNAVRVELYADGINGSGPMRQEMKLRPANWPSASGATFIARQCLRPVQQQIIRRVSYRTAMALRCRWKTLLFCGSGD